MYGVRHGAAIVATTVVMFLCIAAAKRPREAAKEELLEQVDDWLGDFDDDDDGELSATEMTPVLQTMMATSQQSGTYNADMATQITEETLLRMADADGNGRASRSELFDLLVRMKGLDGGHVDGPTAKSPTQRASDDPPAYAESHIERTRKRKKKPRSSKARAAPKDEP